MPNLFELLGYKVYFWANEGNEPVHVHISKGCPSPSATKIWLTQAGGCMVANNNSRIPAKDLNRMLDIIAGQKFYIIREWKEFFQTSDVTFYC